MQAPYSDVLLKFQPAPTTYANLFPFIRSESDCLEGTHTFSYQNNSAQSHTLTERTLIDELTAHTSTNTQTQGPFLPQLAPIVDGIHTTVTANHGTTSADTLADSQSSYGVVPEVNKELEVRVDCLQSDMVGPRQSQRLRNRNQSLNGASYPVVDHTAHIPVSQSGRAEERVGSALEYSGQGPGTSNNHGHGESAEILVAMHRMGSGTYVGGQMNGSINGPVSHEDGNGQQEETDGRGPEEPVGSEVLAPEQPDATPMRIAHHDTRDDGNSPQDTVSNPEEVTEMESPGTIIGRGTLLNFSHPPPSMPFMPTSTIPMPIQLPFPRSPMVQQSSYMHSNVVLYDPDMPPFHPFQQPQPSRAAHMLAHMSFSSPPSSPLQPIPPVHPRLGMLIGPTDPMPPRMHITRTPPTTTITPLPTIPLRKYSTSPTTSPPPNPITPTSPLTSPSATLDPTTPLDQLPPLPSPSSPSTLLTDALTLHQEAQRRRVRNTEAARRSRQKKAGRLKDLEVECREMRRRAAEAERLVGEKERERVASLRREEKLESRVRELEVQLSEAHRMIMERGSLL
ncbi:hypothetical protein HDV00_012666 [Rhizophlyctis rosea]|nr:hypothetical protein HDV00_012666 [Rhizophlyctis rosea]